MNFGHEVKAADVTANETRPEGELLQISVCFLDLVGVIVLIVLLDELLEVIVGDSAVITMAQLLRILVISTERTSVHVVFVGTDILTFTTPAYQTFPIESVATQNGNIKVLINAIPLFLYLAFA